MEENKTKVGVGVMVMKGNKTLLCKRKGSHGSGEYAFPGGHLEYMESFEQCALREIKEECDIQINNIRFQFVSNVKKYAPKHYVHIGLVTDWVSGEPKLLEPDRAASWNWYDMDDLPQPLFETCRQQIEAFQKGINYFDAPK